MLSAATWMDLDITIFKQSKSERERQNAIYQLHKLKYNKYSYLQNRNRHTKQIHSWLGMGKVEARFGSLGLADAN